MRNALTRIRKFAVGTDPIEIYLKVKKQKHRADPIIGVQTLKDIAVQPIIIAANLDARKNLLALQAWRELYYAGFETKQVVKVLG